MGRGHAGADASAKSLAVVGALPIAASLPALWSMQEELARGHVSILLVLLFPFVGLLLWWSALRLVLEARRFGEVSVALEGAPPRVGGELNGTVEVPRGLPEDVVPWVSLSCERRELRRRSHSTRTATKVLWSREGPALVRREEGRALLRIAFAIPDGVPASSAGEEVSHRWVLAVAASLPGVDLDRRLEVSVGSGPGVRTRAPGTYTDDTELLAPLDPRQVRTHEQHGLLEVVLPAGRRLGDALGLGLFALVFLGGGVVPIGAGLGWLGLPLALVFVPVGLVLGGVALQVAGRRITLTLDAETLTRQDSWWGLRTYRAVMPLSEVGALRVGVSGTHVQMGRSRARFSVHVLHGDRPVELASDLPDSTTALGLAARLRVSLAWRGVRVALEDVAPPATS